MLKVTQIILNINSISIIKIPDLLFPIYTHFFYQNKLSIEQKYYITNLEYQFLKSDDIKSFPLIFAELNKCLPSKYSHVKWNELGNYFYYIWQASRYYSDKKKNIKNIYSDSEYVELNEKKRKYFYLWLISFKKDNFDFNSFVLFLKNKGI